jgi:hypothetical protein
MRVIEVRRCLEIESTDPPGLTSKWCCAKGASIIARLVLNKVVAAFGKLRSCAATKVGQLRELSRFLFWSFRSLLQLFHWGKKIIRLKFSAIVILVTTVDACV